MLEAARELKLREKGDWLYELCSVAVSPGSTKEYVQTLRDYYKDMSANAIPEYRPKKQISRTAIPWGQASQIMWDAMKQKKRLECGRQ